MRGRRGAQFQHLQQGRRVTAQGGEVLADQVQVVEAFRPGQQLGLADALGELVPGNHRLDGGIGVAAAFLRFQQRLADPGVQAHLVVGVVSENGK
ncbi:hypothetical protein DQZ82_23870 [Salmonella enterica subsp. enterica serovar Virchow]|nr:hypothetical protein [Salmonella enterica subsp. enterica serovar Virchow]EBX0941102.1 hypothetical protein [Salmonella enterica subsp. enterica serovar Virchow]MLL56040.1 hypothetical protein [Salmonella enterica subsp. enterica serovar Virchow]